MKKRLAYGAAFVLLALSACGRSTQSVGVGAGGTSQGHTGDSSAGGAQPPLTRCRDCASDEECCLETGKCYSPSAAPEECEPPVPGAGSAGRTGNAGGTSTGPLTPPGERCSSNAHCAEGEFCRPDSDAAACVSAGYCVAKSCSLNCTGDAACETPVCGCDGETYSTENDACEAGVRTATTAPCGEPVGSPAPGAPVIGCGSNSDCPDQYSCCEISGRCYPDDCPGCCAPTPPGTNGPCEKDEHCPSGQYCSGTGCGKPGGCAWPKSSVDCSGEASEVCGCDGKTYTNACWAAAAATRVAANGRCR